MGFAQDDKNRIVKTSVVGPKADDLDLTLTWAAGSAQS